MLRHYLWAEGVGRAPPGGVWVGVWFSSRLYYPFGKGPGQHIIWCLKNKKCENERHLVPKYRVYTVPKYATSSPPARGAHFHQLYPKIICHVIPQLLDVARNPGPPSHFHCIYVYNKSLLSPDTGRHSGKRDCSYSAPIGNERTWSASTNADAAELLLDIARNPGPPSHLHSKQTDISLPPTHPHGLYVRGVY